MSAELKEIKKKYGEEMAHFYREYFSSILEKEGVLSSLLMNHFDESHELYNDLRYDELLPNFVQYIYSFLEEPEELPKSNKTPQELLSIVGYNLYECKTEEEIQTFKKYYAPQEELCTFHDNRLNTCYVFFAVKKNVEEIKRENFPNPERQDEYGTSVLSIQFDRETHQLSIKNRYNHTVKNPDSTFSNNLENIISGLTSSFTETYGLKPKYIPTFEILGYVMVHHKFYRYNVEINNNYYCSNNIFIKNNEVVSYEKERYILFDYFLLDMKEKKISCLDEELDDSFIRTIGNIKKIEIEKEKGDKKIIFINDLGNRTTITINSNNQMISYQNNDIEKIEDNFCKYNETLQKVILSNVKVIGDEFCRFNNTIKELYIPSVISIGNKFCYHNKEITIFEAPNLEEVGSCFCYYNKKLEKFYGPKLRRIGNYFCHYNRTLTYFEGPNVESIGNYFCYMNSKIEKLYVPKLKNIGYCFCSYNKSLTCFEAPNLEKIVYEGFFHFNENMKILIMPKVKNICDIIDLLYQKLPLEVLELDNEIMAQDYPLILDYKLRKLKEEQMSRQQELQLRSNRK